jgi:SAM-dependent methyltransferase
MTFLSDAKTYSEHWDAESEQYARTGIYQRLSEITPTGNVLEIGSGIGHATLLLSSRRKVLALDNNEYLAEKARARLAAAGVDAEIRVEDIFSLSPECVEAIKQFAPKVTVAWFIGSHGDDQRKRVGADVPLIQWPQKYRENVEDAIFSSDLCPPSIEWVHLVTRAQMPTKTSIPLADAKQDQMDNYDKYVFQPNGFKSVDIQILDWNRAGSEFDYVFTGRPDEHAGDTVPKIISLLAQRNTI